MTSQVSLNFFGILGDRLRKKYLLSLLYLSRAVVITLFLVLPISNISAIAFGCAIGFLWQDIYKSLRN
jgi:hypothetical protein